MVVYRILHIPSATYLSMPDTDDFYEDTRPIDLDYVLSLRPFLTQFTNGKLTLTDHDEFKLEEIEFCKIVNAYRHELTVHEVEVDGVYYSYYDKHKCCVIMDDGTERIKFYSESDLLAATSNCNIYFFRLGNLNCYMYLSRFSDSSSVPRRSAQLNPTCLSISRLESND